MTTRAEIDDAYKTALWYGAAAAAVTWLALGTFLYTRPTEAVMLGGVTTQVTQSQVQALLSLIAGIVLPRLLLHYPRVLEWLRGLLPKPAPLDPEPAGPSPLTAQLDRIEASSKATRTALESLVKMLEHTKPPEPVPAPPEPEVTP